MTLFTATRTAVVLVLFLCSTVSAHTYVNFPAPRRASDNGWFGGNVCGSESTDVPTENTFARGQTVDGQWGWNNHRGGFIKWSIVPGIQASPDINDFLATQNVLQWSCYTNNCVMDGFDPGYTKFCSNSFTIPSHLADGDYTLLWSQYGSYDSDANPNKLLTIYHTCMNVRISGGSALTAQPSCWKAPFVGGDMQQINGQSAGNQQCAYKEYTADVADPSQYNADVAATQNTADQAVGAPSDWASLTCSSSGDTSAPLNSTPPSSRNSSSASPSGSVGGGSGDGSSTPSSPSLSTSAAPAGGSGDWNNGDWNNDNDWNNDWNNGGSPSFDSATPSGAASGSTPSPSAIDEAPGSPSSPCPSPPASSAPDSGSGDAASGSTPSPSATDEAAGSPSSPSSSPSASSAPDSGSGDWNTDGWRKDGWGNGGGNWGSNDWSHKKRSSWSGNTAQRRRRRHRL